MKVSLLNILPTPSEALVRVIVLFERKKEFGDTPVATEGARVELHIESSGSYADLKRRAFEKSRELLQELANAEAESFS